MLRNIERCLCCWSPFIELVLDLGEQPLANSYPPEPMELPKFPLALNYCRTCSHLQLTHSVDRSQIFTDYPYVSGTTSTLRDEFTQIAQRITAQHGVGTILDIACNDGSQLNAFKELGWKTIGIDPAKNLYPLSSANHEVYCDFLNDNHRSLKADVIIAQNVLAHTDNPHKFLDICSDIAPICYIQTSQADMIKNGEFDTIYHEHISFFSERSMRTLALNSGWTLSAISRRPVHGVSYLFQLSRGIAGTPVVQVADVASRDKVDTFVSRAKSVIRNLREVLAEEQLSGRRVIGYGAAAKGMTVLNAVGEPLDYIVDDNSLKHGLYTPGLNIPIREPAVLGEETHDITVIPLAWNFYPEIRRKTMNYSRSHVKFIKYFPELMVEWRRPS